jgi:multidrug efflux pump subunit AcrA (membrane-fusion protein)
MMQIFSGLPIRRLAAALLTVSLLAGCADEGGAGPSAATAAKPALTVRLVAPERAEWPELLVANGDVVAWQEAVIGAEVANYRIAEVRVQVGDAVRRGDVLARIASDTVASELAEAAAAAAEAEAAAGEAAGNAERANELRAQGFYSAQLHAQYQSAERLAAARLSAARARQHRRLAREEARRLALELVAQRLLRFEHGRGARAERAVVQVGDRWVERPVSREIGRVVHGRGQGGASARRVPREAPDAGRAPREAPVAATPV